MRIVSGDLTGLTGSESIGLQGTIGLQSFHSEFCPYSEHSVPSVGGGWHTEGVHCSEDCLCDYKRPPRNYYKSQGDCLCKLCRGEKQ